MISNLRGFELQKIDHNEKYDPSKAETEKAQQLLQVAEKIRKEHVFSQENEKISIIDFQAAMDEALSTYSADVQKLMHSFNRYRRDKNHDVEYTAFVKQGMNLKTLLNKVKENASLLEKIIEFVGNETYVIEGLNYSEKQNCLYATGLCNILETNNTKPAYAKYFPMVIEDSMRVDLPVCHFSILGILRGDKCNLSIEEAVKNILLNAYQCHICFGSPQYSFSDRFLAKCNENCPDFRIGDYVYSSEKQNQNLNVYREWKLGNASSGDNGR